MDLKRFPPIAILVVASSFIATFNGHAHAEESRGDVIVVVGASGTVEFGTAFAKWNDVWTATCDRANLNLQTIGPASASSDEDQPDRQRLRSSLDSLAKSSESTPVWIILIGHGTWDGSKANFNLVGPDVSAKEIDEWLRPIKRPIVLVNCTSSSSPFINRLSAKNRVVVTATKSGSEKNYARFGQYFAAAFAAIEADLDHDDSVSVFEAFLKASADADRFYKEQGRLATEHALLDDNADKKGSSFALLRGLAQIKGEGDVDGALAKQFSIPATVEAIQLSSAQLAKRNKLEERLRQIQSEHAGDDKTALREAALPVLIELANLYAEAESN